MNLSAARRPNGNAVVGALVFLFALGVYAYCITPTVPYWDSGEFIATSYILGIPHPPGTPLYVLIGRLFSLLPIAATVAVRVNLLSALSSAIAVLFTYLIIVRLINRNLKDDIAAMPWLAWVGGAVGAMFMAFSPTFWDNSIEAEVYGGASAIMCFCVWLALYWWDRQDQPQNDRFLWLILYVLFLAIGIHLGSFLVFPCIYLLVTMVHWARVRKGQFWGSIVLFIAALLIRTAIIQQAFVTQGVKELSMASPGTEATAGFFFFVMAVAFVWNMSSVLGWRFLAGVAVLALIGVSVHFYLLIRSRIEPAIDEADPSNLHSLFLVLTRDQYKPPDPIFRNAPIGYQVGHMYLRYFKDQFYLFGSTTLPTWILPITLGLYGAFINLERDRKSFFLMLTLYLITGPFLVYYLNFKVGEVRERDYFFVANFHFFMIWIGLGTIALIRDLLGLFQRRGEFRAPRWAAAVLAGIFLIISVMPLAAGENNDNFFIHNRRGNYLAHGLAYNMLVGLDRDAIIFTNGDNDTFPLWYIQEVEHFRKDVRVVNLSLLQTDWYIKQLRDDPPKVPITLNNGQIEALAPVRDEAGKIHWVNNIMVDHIIKTNAWKRPVYLAVTVPDQQGLEDRLKMEGLVFRVYKDKVDNPVDVAKLEDNLDHKYEYRGFLKSDGSWNASVYKDDQSTRLLQNYAAAWVRLALGYYQEGREDLARAELLKVQKFSGHFPGVDVALGLTYEQLGMKNEALTYYHEYLQKNPDDPSVLSALAHLQYSMGDSISGIATYRRAINVAPGADFTPYGELANIYRDRGDYDSLVAILQSWLQLHPEDTRVRDYLGSVMSAVPGRTGGTTGAVR